MSVTADAPTALDRPRFFVDGRWVEPAGTESRRALEASNGALLGTAALGGPADIDAAVRAARRAFDDGPWGRTTAAQRATVMRDFADRLAEINGYVPELVSRENGMPITLSGFANGSLPVELLRRYADQIERTELEEVRPSELGSTIVRREAVGVVAAITPWNYPQVLALTKIAPALAAGCTVVLKPSPDTALDSYVLAEAAERAGLPPGVLNVVLAEREAGATLVSHPLVDKVAFTGSTAAGRVIGAECGRLVRRVTLELGGKSAALFLDDGDVDAFLRALPGTIFQNSSQTCTTQARVLIARSRYDEVVEALAAHSRNLVVGDPLDERTEIGPMANERQHARVMGYIRGARESGARLVTGGGRPRGLNAGWFVEPTVFADVDPASALAREEVFGPVVATMPFDTDDEAVALADDSNYGLGGSVFTADEERGLAIARRVRTGTFGVNYYAIDTNAPAGGFKDSGIGREWGPEGLAPYLEYKSIYASVDRLAGPGR